MMKNELDNFEHTLKDALLEKDSLSLNLINETRAKLYNKETANMRLNNRRSLKWVVSVAAGIMFMGVTALAAWNLLTPSDVASELDDAELAIAFDSEDAIHINETMASEGYIFTLLSIVTGDDLTDTPIYVDGYVQNDRTYAIVAIKREDHTPMNESTSSLFSSPYVRGFAPWQVNIASLGLGAGGGHQEKIVDGVLYRLIETGNIEVFADHGVYLGISLGTSSFDAIDFDAETGALSLNPDFNGPSVLFELPFDDSLADAERAQEILDEIFFAEEDDVDELHFIDGFDCTTEFERLENMTEYEMADESNYIFSNEPLDLDDERTYCNFEFHHMREAERLEKMTYAEMTYDELADFLETRIERDMANGEPEGVISGARRDREDTLRTMREYNIEYAEVWYDDSGMLISLTNPEYAE